MTDLDKLHAEVVTLVAELLTVCPTPGCDCVAGRAITAFRALLEGIAAMRRERDEASGFRNHFGACNFWMKPLGSPGCICEVAPRGALKRAEAERDALQRDLDAALAKVAEAERRIAYLTSDP